MSAAAKLRALRKALPGSPGVRAIAAVLGYEKHNAYGYYESADFKKDTLPLDKAREFASAFVTLGGSAEEVLALAGLSDAEQAIEVKPIVAAQPPVQLMLPVSLPDHDRLTRMMRGLLKGLGLDEVAEQHSVELAHRLPDALAIAASNLAPMKIDRAANPVARPPLDAMRDHGHS